MLSDKGRVFGGVLILSLLVFGVPAHAQQTGVRVYNTVKQKLAAGERVVGGTVTSPDPASTDLSSFSGLAQGDPLYEQMVAEIAGAVGAAGRHLGRGRR